jgi:hypothetical protein
MNKKVKFFYGIIPIGQKQVFDITGIDDALCLYTIPYADIAAVVCDVEEKLFDPTRHNVLTFNTAIIKIIEDDFSIIPAKFGTVFSSVHDVEIFLEKFYPHAKKLFVKIINKIELGLKVFWRDESFAKLINVEEVIRLKEQIELTGDKEVDYLKMQLGELVKQIVEKKRTYYIKEIHDRLAKRAVDEVINENLVVKMVFNAAYLVERDRIEKFQLEVRKLTERYKDTLDFKFTGPWPPYNFTTMRIKFTANND